MKKKKYLDDNKEVLLAKDEPTPGQYISQCTLTREQAKEAGKRLGKHLETACQTFDQFFDNVLPQSNDELRIFVNHMKNNLLYHFLADISEKLSWEEGSKSQEIKKDGNKIKIIHKNFSNDNSILLVINQYFFLAQLTHSLLTSSNWKTIAAIMELNKEKEYYKSLVDNGNYSSNKVKKNKNGLPVRPGRPGKFNTKEELIKAIKSIPNRESLSKNQIARKLGYKGKTPSSSLSNLLKDKLWDIDVKNI